MDDTAQRSGLAWYWLLPAAFLVHDAEELLTLPTWVVSHRAELAVLAQELGAGDRALAILPTTTSATACAIGLLATGFAVVTWGAQRAGGHGAWQVGFAVLLGGFFLHGFTHLAQVAYFGAYVPGAATAAFVVLPASLYLYARLKRAGLLCMRHAAIHAALGLALFVPAVILALAVGTALCVR